MSDYIGRKYRLYPNKKQRIFFSKTFGCCRKIWNLLLNDYNNKIIKLNDSIVPYKEQFPYLNEVDSMALQQEQIYLINAMNAYYNINRNRPKFKKKNDKQSYTTTVTNNNIRLININPYINKKQKGYIRLPKIGLIKIIFHQSFPINAVIKRVTVTKTLTNEYYISLILEYDNQMPKTEINLNNSIGLDYSLDQLFVASGNIKTHYVDWYREYEYRLIKYQKLRDKASKGSKKKYKFTMKYRKLHQKIKNKRRDYLHKLSYYLSRVYDFIFIEDLDLKQIASSNSEYHLGKTVYDNGYGMFISFLNYKMNNLYKYLITIDKYYPSTQLCSICGYKNIALHNNLSTRIWKCPKCNTFHDRDVNAAYNILHRGIQLCIKYNIYLSSPLRHENIPIQFNTFANNLNTYAIPQYHPVLQEIAKIIPPEQRKKHVVEQVPLEQRKKLSDGSNASTDTTTTATTTTTTTSQKMHIVEQVPLELRKKID